MKKVLKKLFNNFVIILALLIYPFWTIKNKLSFVRNKLRSILVYYSLRNKKIKVGKNLIVGKRVTINIRKNSKVVIGKNVKIGDDVYIKVAERAKLIIGDEVHINRSTRISSNELIEIGDYTLLAPYCNILDHNHVFNLKSPVSAKSFNNAPIIIGEGVWLGVKVQVNKGVKIGNYSVIGANSVVTKDVPPSSVYGGIPAKKIK